MDSSQVGVQARKLQLNVHDQSSVQDNFRTATDALYKCNVVERRRVEGIYKDETQLRVLEENLGNRGH
jgi:hypothetical protein